VRARLWPQIITSTREQPRPSLADLSLARRHEKRWKLPAVGKRRKECGARVRDSRLASSPSGFSRSARILGPHTHMRHAYACTRVCHNGTRDAFMRIIRYGRDGTRAESSSAALRIADVRVTARSRIREPEMTDVLYSWPD